jgi:hypothetical protein
MADEKIPYQDVAGAKFATRSYSGPLEPYFDLSAEVIDIDVPYVLGADTNLAAFTPVNYNKTTKAITKAVFASGNSNATHVLGQPLQGLNGATGRVGLKTSGHFAMDGLVWDASFDTDDKKQFAFAAAGDNIRVSKRKFSNDVIDIPN